MARRFGLRTEIIVNLLLLMGAALLFSGLLLFNLAERLMVRERVVGIQRQMETTAHLLVTGGDAGLNRVVLESLPAALAESDGNWLLVDAQQGIVARSHPTLPAFSAGEVAGISRERLVSIHLDYTSALLSFGRQPEDLVRVNVPLYRGQEYFGALCGVFSLAPVKTELQRVGGIYCVYIAIYGLLLLVFGFYLLRKAVVKPVRQLTGATQRVAHGDLMQQVAPEGPKELTELAEAFNRMIGSLRKSRAETEDSIRQLRSVNDELCRTRDELVRAERLASVGHLAAGVAHEIGNPLGAVIGYIDLLQSELPPGRQLEVAARAGQEAARIDRLVRELLDYAAPSARVTTSLEPATVLRDAVMLLTQQGKLENVRIDNQLPAALAQVTIDRDKLLQVFINLLCNACDALASQVGRNGDEALLLQGGGEGNTVWLAIADNGSGIPSEILPGIFDPFFTTKEPGKGRGLGLAVCYRNVTEAGGRIEVESTPERGSRFKVVLPQAAEEKLG